MSLLLPHLLLIDTCGATGAIALADTEASPAVFSTQTLPGRTASERLIPGIKQLLADNGTSLHSLGAIAVVNGPGSFTGVRVGVSAAKGLCEALGIPLIAISRLAVLSSLARGSQRSVAVLDAGRGEFYVGEYAGEACNREALLTREQLLAAVESSPATTAIIACEPVVAASLELPIDVVPEPAAATALPLALRRIESRSFDDIATLDANYVRRTDAEIFAKPKPALAGLPKP